MTKDFRYEGFSAPNYTPVPDDVFDVIAPELTESELRVLLYILRRTFGFKRNSDAISLTQMVEGIKTRDGRQLDRGAGLSRRGVMAGCAGLVEKHIITVEKRISPQGDNEINVYSLRFRPGVGHLVPYGGELAAPGVGNQLPPQETGRQETGRQQFEISKGITLVQKYDDVRLAILPFAEDLARELGDQAPLTSTTTRLTNLFRDSGLELDVFLDLLITARAITQERTPAIRTPRPEGPGPKPKMAYWFTVLEDLIGQSLAATGTADD